MVSFSGGGAILAIDAIEGAGLELAKLSEDTIRDISELFPPWLTVDNPVDIWIPVARDFDASFPRILERVLQDPGVDAVICIYCSYTLPKYDALNSSRYIGEIASHNPEIPILCWTYGLDISGFTRKIEEQGTAMVFPSLESAGTAIAKMADYQAFVSAPSSAKAARIRRGRCKRQQSARQCDAIKLQLSVHGKPRNIGSVRDQPGAMAVRGK